MNKQINGVLSPMTKEEVSEIEKLTAVEAPPAAADQALAMPDILPTWSELLERGEKIKQGAYLMKDGQCYRAMQDVTPIESQPPGADGMLAVYRPIDKEHAGTLEDPIPWVNGMDCFKDKYYSNEGKVYLCKQDMTPCVWAPGTEGVWQWEVVS